MTSITIMLITITILLCIIMILLWWQYDANSKGLIRIIKLLEDHTMDARDQAILEELKDIKFNTRSRL